jgi:hypothetical protein
MSPEHSTRALIDRLARELEPVHPISSLRRIGAALLFVWLATGAPVLLWNGLRDDLAEAAATAPAYAAIFATLIAMALGGVVSSLALCIPGREAAARAGAGLVALGLLGSVAIALSPFFGAASPGYLAGSLRYDATCLGVASALAVPVVGFLLGFGHRAAPFAALPAAASAGLGAVAAGAVVVHLMCGEACARHLIGSHALAPLVGGLTLAFPGQFFLRRRRAHSSPPRV